MTTYTYDAIARVVLGKIHFDAKGRMTKRVSSETFETHTYDSHGNLSEWARWKDEVLIEGTRWDNRYEGDPPRLVAQEISDFRKPKERNAPHTRLRFEYDATGRVNLEEKDGPRGMALRSFEWRGDRIVTIQGSLGPRYPTDEMPYDEGLKYEYDAQGRLSTFVVDGEMPYGEGATADGKTDHRATFHYDAAGRLERIERDGWGGDVAPEVPDGKLDEVVLLTPPCDPIVKLAPWLFYLPDLSLPHSIEPRLQ
jgi:hypothetical protein